MKETIGIDYEKEYLKLSLENNNLRKENEELKETVLAMAKTYITIDKLNDIIRNIEKELRTLNKRK